jgi:2Fe-2S ferredoxin
MPNVTYVQSDGTRSTLEVKLGQSVMEASVRAGLPGIVAECGGSCSCATCHVYVEEEWLDKIEPATPDEIDLFGFVAGPQDNSRLACQIIITPKLDGLVVHTPEQGNQ